MGCPPPVARVAPTMGDVVKKYLEKEVPKLAASTRNTQNGQLKFHIEPKWGKKPLTEIHPGEVQDWIETVPLSQVSKGQVMVLMRRLYKLAMRWGGAPCGVQSAQPGGS